MPGRGYFIIDRLQSGGVSSSWLFRDPYRELAELMNLASRLGGVSKSYLRYGTQFPRPRDLQEAFPLWYCVKVGDQVQCHS